MTKPHTGALAIASLIVWDGLEMEERADPLTPATCILSTPNLNGLDDTKIGFALADLARLAKRRIKIYVAPPAATPGAWVQVFTFGGRIGRLVEQYNIRTDSTSLRCEIFGC